MHIRYVVELSLPLFKVGVLYVMILYMLLWLYNML